MMDVRTKMLADRRDDLTQSRQIFVEARKKALLEIRERIGTIYRGDGDDLEEAEQIVQLAVQNLAFCAGLHSNMTEYKFMTEVLQR